MEKIKFGFIIISFIDTIEIYVDEKTGIKYLMTGHDYYEGDGYCSGLTQMLDVNGKPDRFTKEEVEYLKSIALPLNPSRNHANYQHLRRSKKEHAVAYYSIEL